METSSQQIFRLGSKRLYARSIPPKTAEHRDHKRAASTLRRAIRRHLRELKKLSPEELVEQRYKKFREMGRFKIVK